MLINTSFTPKYVESQIKLNQTQKLTYKFSPAGAADPRPRQTPKSSPSRLIIRETKRKLVRSREFGTAKEKPDQNTNNISIN